MPHPPAHAPPPVPFPEWLARVAVLTESEVRTTLAACGRRLAALCRARVAADAVKPYVLAIDPPGPPAARRYVRHALPGEPGGVCGFVFVADVADAEPFADRALAEFVRDLLRDPAHLGPRAAVTVLPAPRPA